MPVVVRSATEADAKRVESLLAELGHPSKEADVRHRLGRSLRSDASCFLVAQSASEVIGLVSAELVPYFPNGNKKTLGTLGLTIPPAMLMRADEVVD